jgi:putative drug exporter of the RND superfamily
MAFVDTFFAAAGRLSVRFRWAIVAIWVAGAFAAMALLPSLSSVTQSDNTSFLPASAPSEQAAQLASPLQGASLTEVTVVAAATGRPLTGADQAAIARLPGALSRADRVAGLVRVRDAGESADGQAEEFSVLASLAQSGGLATTQQARLVAQLRGAIRAAALPAGLQAHLAGPVATRVDDNAVSTKTGGQVQWFSIIFVIALLVAVFRSALAPLIAVLPAAVVVLVAERLTAEVAVHGLAVSQIASLLLIVLVLGAGTDYALFLMFRVREEMRAGLACHEAIVFSVGRVGETITFSAGILIAALLSLAAASFTLYSGLAAPLAIAIGLMLIAGLTLLPALLAIAGPVAFWPSSVKPGAGRAGWWGPACARIVRRPVATLVAGLVVFGALAVASAGYLAAGFGGAVTAPAGSDSALGNALLARHFPQTAVNPTIIVLRLRQPVWVAAAAVAAAERQLAGDPQFTAVSGPFDANGTALTAAQYAALHAAYGPPRGLAASAAAIPRGGLAAYQAYRASGSFVSADGETISFATSLTAGNPASTAAAQAVPAVRADAARAARVAGAAALGVTGQAAFTYDVAQLSDSDLRTVIPIAIAVIAVLLALVMRSLIAPLYLILSVVLSYFSALGLTVLVFIKGAGQPGLTFILPFLLFMFLLALGEDYNILVMMRIREEAHRLPLPEAVSRALRVTGTTVTSAGLVLAGTFGVLAIVGSGSAGAQNVRTIVDVGVGLALGVLMDTFLVRTLLVPSAVVLIGRWNWWPSRLCWQRPSGEAADSFTTYKLLLKMTSEGSRGPGGSLDPSRGNMTAPGTAVEHLGAEYFQDPNAVHARLRAERPVSAVIMPGGMPAWLITGYAEARAALTDQRLRKSWPGRSMAADSMYAALELHMLNSDPPDHERLRRLVNKAFTSRRVELLRPRITAITTELLDDMSTQRDVDLLASFAFPLPITVICELLGIPVADRDDFRKWSATIVSDTVSAAVFEADAGAMIGYFMALLAAKRREPADDLLSALIATGDEGDRLSENELVSMAFLLLLAGHETTVNLIASGMLALLLNPGQLDRLQADPSLLGRAVEELLRYVSPVNHATFRFAAEPVEIGGARIGQDQPVLVALSSADRDPSRYAAPDRLDLGRDSSGHLAFGHGIHYCLGAPLARLEAEIAFGGLLSRFGSMRLAVPAESLRWRPSTLIHGLEALPVRLRP